MIMRATQNAVNKTVWQGVRDKVIYVVLATVLSAIILYFVLPSKPAEGMQIADNRSQTTIVNPAITIEERTQIDTGIALTLVKNEPGQRPTTITTKVDKLTSSEEKKENLPILELVDPYNKLPSRSPNGLFLKFVAQTLDQADPNGLHDYYGLDLKLYGNLISYTIGAPSISRYFKLKGSKHKGMFIITNKPELYYTNDFAVYNRTCNFYKIYAVYGGGWANETSPCAEKFFSLARRLEVYPCTNIMYKIGESNIVQADEYKFTTSQ